MSERLVEVPISKQTRDDIKRVKGQLTYDQFFKQILECQDENYRI